MRPTVVTKLITVPEPRHEKACKLWACTVLKAFFLHLYIYTQRHNRVTAAGATRPRPPPPLGPARAYPSPTRPRQGPDIPLPPPPPPSFLPCREKKKNTQARGLQAYLLHTILNHLL